MKIQPIVEGHGEVKAAPELLRRLITEAQLWDVEVGRPIRMPRNQLVRETELKRAVRLALLQPDAAPYWSSLMETRTVPPNWVQPSRNGRKQ